MIDFIAAKNGNIELYSGDELMFVSSKFSEISFYLAYKGMADAYSFSSSMDFASEYGFEDDDDAKKLFFAALNMSGKIIVN